jgi:hypothetical protein
MGASHHEDDSENSKQNGKLHLLSHTRMGEEEMKHEKIERH